jgi:chromate reductase
MIEPAFKICAISGSLRKGSFNTALLRAVQELAPAGMAIEIAPIGDVPLYNEDLRVDGSLPPAVERLREAIRAADAVLFATPEYNFSVSGVLKNTIDWISRPPNQPLDGKACAILGAASGVMGTSRAQAHLRQVLVNVNAFAVNVPPVFIASSAQKFDSEGKLTDENVRNSIGPLLAALVELAGKLKS